MPLPRPYLHRGLSGGHVRLRGVARRGWNCILGTPPCGFSRSYFFIYFFEGACFLRRPPWSPAVTFLQLGEAVAEALPLPLPSRELVARGTRAVGVPPRAWVLPSWLVVLGCGIQSACRYFIETQNSRIGRETHPMRDESIPRVTYPTRDIRLYLNNSRDGQPTTSQNRIAVKKTFWSLCNTDLSFVYLVFAKHFTLLLKNDFGQFSITNGLTSTETSAI
ncbi:uncharacterized protein LOC141550441 [Sminthopsis crassicaudata]|uniref:uncharacterized protein LOC141550441 n=1 Tax=Sminthopsis crassicaudata TaxID=9301 RepID=UPI003D69368B